MEDFVKRYTQAANRYKNANNSFIGLGTFLGGINVTIVVKPWELQSVQFLDLLLSLATIAGISFLSAVLISIYSNILLNRFLAGASLVKNPRDIFVVFKKTFARGASLKNLSQSLCVTGIACTLLFLYARLFEFSWISIGASFFFWIVFLGIGYIYIRFKAQNIFEDANSKYTQMLLEEHTVYNAKSEPQQTTVKALNFNKEETVKDVVNWKIIEEIHHYDGYLPRTLYKGELLHIKKPVTVIIFDEKVSKIWKKKYRMQIDNLRQLKHPNLVSVISGGEYSGRLYCVLDYIEGIFLEERVKEQGIYEEKEAIAIILQLAEALDCAAKKNLYHPRLSPGKIMITEDNKIKLWDVGLYHKSKSNLTNLGLTVRHTKNKQNLYPYMSPEEIQKEVKLPNAQSNIFSLGAIFYFMLTTVSPFSGHDIMDTTVKIVTETPTSILEYNSKISEETCIIIDKMLEKNRRQRYRNFQELLKTIYPMVK